MGKCLEKTKDFFTAIGGQSDAVTNATTIKGVIKAFANDGGADTSKVETISDAIAKVVELESGSDSVIDPDSNSSSLIV